MPKVSAKPQENPNISQNKLSNELKNQAKQGQAFEKQIQEWIEISKFHEQRGKVKCKCYQCQKVQERLKAEMSFSDDSDKEQCSNCNRWVKELDELNDLCKKCLESYE